MKTNLTFPDRHLRSHRTAPCFLAVFLSWLTLAGPAQGQPADLNDELAIGEVFKQVNRVCTVETAEEAVAIMNRLISDKGYAAVYPVPDEPSEVWVADKKALLETLAQSLRQGSRWGVHMIEKIVIVGVVAYEIGETKDPNPEAKDRGVRWVNVLAKEEAGWKLVYSTRPPTFKKRCGNWTLPKRKPRSEATDPGSAGSARAVPRQIGKRNFESWPTAMCSGHGPTSGQERPVSCPSLPCSAGHPCGRGERPVGAGDSADPCPQLHLLSHHLPFRF